MELSINDISGSFSPKEISRFLAFREVMVSSRVNTERRQISQRQSLLSRAYLSSGRMNDTPVMKNGQ